MEWKTIKPETILGYTPSGAIEPNLWSVKVCVETETGQCYLIKCRKSIETGCGEIKLAEILLDIADVEELFDEYVQTEQARILRHYPKYNQHGSAL